MAGTVTASRLHRYSQHFHLLGEPVPADWPADVPLDDWSGRCCGLACLRTVLHHHGLPVPTQAELLSRALEAAAFSPAGMIHARLVDVASGLGLGGRAVPVQDARTLFALGTAGYPPITSVTHALPTDGRRGGHLVVADRVDEDDPSSVRFVDPSRWGRDHDRATLARFTASWSGRAVVLWPGPGSEPPPAVATALGVPQ